MLENIVKIVLCKRLEILENCIFQIHSNVTIKKYIYKGFE